jgi:hypothetical protein
LVANTSGLNNGLDPGFVLCASLWILSALVAAGRQRDRRQIEPDGPVRFRASPKPLLVVRTRFD